MQTNPATHQTFRALRRPHRGRVVAGVAAGVADELDVDAAVVRVGLVVLTLMGGLGVPLYLAAWLIVPDECDDESIVERLLGHECRGPAWDVASGTPGAAMASAPRRTDAPWTPRPHPEQAASPAPPVGPDPEARRSHDVTPS